MGAIQDAADALTAALAPLNDPARPASMRVRATQDPGRVTDPPVVVVGPPDISWEAYTTAPTSARFRLLVVVAFDERAIGRLYELVPEVAAAVETVDGATVGTATPAPNPAGSTELPAYVIPVDVAL